jgi:hypothetical protein
MEYIDKVVLGFVLILFYFLIYFRGHTAGGAVVEALRYKLEGCGIDS